MNSKNQMACDLLVFFIVIVCTYKILKPIYKRQLEREKMLAILYEKWLEASVALGQWISKNPFENHENPQYQKLLHNEIEAHTDLIFLKIEMRGINEQDKQLGREMRSRRVT